MYEDISPLITFSLTILIDVFRQTVRHKLTLVNEQLRRELKNIQHRCKLANSANTDHYIVALISVITCLHKTDKVYSVNDKVIEPYTPNKKNFDVEDQMTGDYICEEIEISLACSNANT